MMEDIHVAAGLDIVAEEVIMMMATDAEAAVGTLEAAAEATLAVDMAKTVVATVVAEAALVEVERQFVCPISLRRITDTNVSNSADCPTLPQFRRLETSLATLDLLRVTSSSIFLMEDQLVTLWSSSKVRLKPSELVTS